VEPIELQTGPENPLSIVRPRARQGKTPYQDRV
jgi:hypothetical protein